ncbi:hypothetical protein BKA62DRAFT_446658 [Auriculariales sp. MPI-PUGE-AT-0066]|nr:hypothetical protein BKA62DRAFT_446658 [Auriculariales sp. MPI-PUGE-AT-0066]
MDGVDFYVHAAILLRASSNAFNSLFTASIKPPGSPGSTLQHYAVPGTDAATLNVVLHVAYGLNVSRYSPDLRVLKQALESVLVTYAFSPYIYVAPASPLYSVLLSQAVTGGVNVAMEVYALAAQHRLEPLAVAVSEQLLSFDLSLLTDEQAIQLGGSYLKRLFVLLMTRVDKLRELLAIEPGPLHPPTPMCDKLERRRDLFGAWAYAVAQLMADARADTPSALLESILNPLAYRCACGECRVAIQQRVQTLVRDWDAVKRTI